MMPHHWRPLAHERNSIFKCKQHTCTLHDPWCCVQNLFREHYLVRPAFVTVLTSNVAAKSIGYYYFVTSSNSYTIRMFTMFSCSIVRTRITKILDLRLSANDSCSRIQTTNAPLAVPTTCATQTVQLQVDSYVLNV